MQHYQDFELDVSRTARTIVVDATSPFGETPQPVQVAFDDRVATRISASAAALVNKQLSGRSLLSFGDELAGLLFPTEVRRLFVKAVHALGPSEGLRLRLKLRDPFLASLPWEFLHVNEISESLAPFLSLHSQISIVRHELSELELPSARPLRKDTLRVLLVDAQNVPGRAALRAADMRLIRESLQGSRGAGVHVDVDLLEEANIKTLHDRLLGSAFDVVHFVGHAEADTRSAHLALHSPDGHEELVPPDVLANLLLEGDVRIAILAACETGARADDGAWLGLASELVLRGLPAVIAMQHEIETSHAALFEAGLLESLAAGLTLDQAVSIGRRRVPGLGILPEWGVPVLYSRSDGVLFSSPSDSASSQSRRRALDDRGVDLSLGQRFEDEGAWAKGAEFYGQCISKLQSARELAIANLRRAACLWRDDDPTGAEECFDQAKDFAREAVDRDLLGEIYLEEALQMEEALEDLSKALKLVEKADNQFSKDSPRRVRVTFARARLHARDGEVRTALKTLHDISVDELPRDLQADHWDTLGFVLWTQGDFDDAVEALEDALRLDEEIGAASQIARTRLLLARAYLGVKRHGEAKAQVNLATTSFESARDEEGLSDAWAVLGEILEDEGRLKDARNAYAKAADFDKAAHDGAGEARVNLQLARVARRRGQLGEAEDALMSARKVLRSSPDDRVRAELATEEALLDLARGEFDSAHKKLQEALDHAETDVEDDRGVAIANLRLAVAMREMGKATQAIERLRTIQPVLEQFEDERALEQLFDELGECHLDLGQLDEAISALKASQKIDEKGPPSREASRTHLLLGRAYMAQANRELAKHHLEIAHQISKGLEDEVGLSDSLLELGLFSSEDGDAQTARTVIREALSLDRKLGDRVGAARCNRALAALARNSRDFNRAIEYLADARDELSQTSDRREKAALQLEIARVHLARGNVSEALTEVDTTTQLFEEVQAALEVVACQRVKALALAAKSDYDGAIALLTDAWDVVDGMGAASFRGEISDELAQVYLSAGNRDLAREYVEKSLEVDHHGGWKSSRGRSYLLKGEIERRFGDFASADRFFQSAAASFRSAEDKLGEADVCLRQGDLCLDRASKGEDRREEAIASYRRARMLYQSQNDAVGTTRCLRKLGELFMMQKSFNRASESLEQARDTIDSSLSPGGPDVVRERAALALATGALLAARGEHAAAIHDYKGAEQGFRSLKREDKVHEALRGQAVSYQHLGDIEKSLACMRQIEIENSRVLATILEYLDESISSPLSAAYREGEHWRVVERVSVLLEKQVAGFATAPPGSPLASLKAVIDAWNSLVNSLAVDRSWHPTSVDAISAAGFAHLVASISVRLASEE